MDKQKKRQLCQDILMMIISIGFAVFVVKTGAARQFVASLYDLQWLGIVFAGVFFTSVFTTAPSVALLGTFAETVSLPALVILGGFGAMLGDYVIFRFMRDRILSDIKYLLSFSKERRFYAIFKTRLFKFFMPFIGALIIASPFPDEIGIAMLGLSNMKDRVFFPLSFILNGTGIFIIGLIARMITNL